MIETPKNSGFIDVWATYRLTMIGRKALSFFHQELYCNVYQVLYTFIKNERGTFNEIPDVPTKQS